MKLLFFLSVILIGFSNVKAQDLIVTHKGDSVNCKITQIKGGYVYFTYVHNENNVNTVLPLDRIKYYKKDYLAKQAAANIKTVQEDYNRFRIGVYGGWSYMTAKVSDQVPNGLQSYIKKLKSGYHFGGTFTYFISEKLGYGFNYSNFRTKNQIGNITARDPITGTTRVGALKDDISVQYFGPSLALRKFSANRMRNFTFDLSLGYLAYKNKATVVDNFTIKSSTVGMMWGLGADFRVDKDFSIGLLLSQNIGILSQFNIDDGIRNMKVKLDKDNFENISRIDFSLVIRWNK